MAGVSYGPPPGSGCGSRIGRQLLTGSPGRVLAGRGHGQRGLASAQNLVPLWLIGRERGRLDGSGQQACGDEDTGQNPHEPHRQRAHPGRPAHGGVGRHARRVGDTAALGEAPRLVVTISEPATNVRRVGTTRLPGSGRGRGAAPAHLSPTPPGAAPARDGSLSRSRSRRTPAVAPRTYVATPLGTGCAVVENPADSRLDLVGQPWDGAAIARGGTGAVSGHAPGGRFGSCAFAHDAVPMATAIPAHQFAEGLGQPPGTAGGALVQHRVDTSGLAVRANQYLLPVDDPPTPGAGAPGRVGLAGRAAEAWHVREASVAEPGQPGRVWLAV